jgi:SAM-dependent methyltransferase
VIRHVAPEILDSLPADDARAVGSRRDLVRVNALMGNTAIVAGALREALPRRSVRVAELGAGDGRFAARALHRAGLQGHVTLVDREARADSDAVSSLVSNGWHVEQVRADVFDWLRSAAPVDALFVNLFLHHFQHAPLAELLRQAARAAPVFVACEPRRSGVALLGSRLLGLVGCNDVTRHDAVVSVRAGFAGDEISRIWPEPAQWQLEERARGLFSHGFVARRR